MFNKFINIRVGVVLGNSLSGRGRVVRFSPFGCRVVFGFVGFLSGPVISGPFISDSMYTSNLHAKHFLKHFSEFSDIFLKLSNMDEKQWSSKMLRIVDTLDSFHHEGMSA